MSGHSHAKTVAATKNANNAKKGKIFAKMANAITISVKEKGADISVNSSLRALMEKAREFNMPKDNIERAIKKGTGELAGEALANVIFEGLGAGGIAFIMEGITDNTNRTLGEIKGILSQHNAKLAGEGAVRWMFEPKGIMEVENPPAGGDLESLAIEAGADDIRDTWIYTKPEDLEAAKKALEEKGVKILSATLGWSAKEEIAVEEKDKEKLERLFEALDENDAIQNIYSNWKN